MDSPARATGIVVAVALSAAIILPASGCGGDSGGSTTEPANAAAAGDSGTTSNARTSDSNRPATSPVEPGKKPELLPLPACPAGSANCSSARGLIIYVEAVDPDGDGDAHFVLASAQAITGPGISVVDVRTDLRPHPLPGIGDELSASGPVYRGSYGQRQIQADVVLAR